MVRLVSLHGGPPKRLHFILGDIVWAQEETKQFFHGLADVVVRGTFSLVHIHS